MWISKDKFKALDKRANDYWEQIGELQSRLRAAENQCEIAQRSIETFKDGMERAQKECDKLKEHLKAKEEMFIGRTIKKLLNEIGKPVVVHNHYASSSLALRQRNASLGIGLG
jgi:chromosome segregation ATPase